MAIVSREPGVFHRTLRVQLHEPIQVLDTIPRLISREDPDGDDVAVLHELELAIGDKGQGLVLPVVRALQTPGHTPVRELVHREHEGEVFLELLPALPEVDAVIPDVVELFHRILDVAVCPFLAFL